MQYFRGKRDFPVTSYIFVYTVDYIQSNPLTLLRVVVEEFNFIILRESWNYIELWDPIYFYQKTKNKFEIKFPHFSLVFPWESIEKYTTRVHHTQDYLKTQYILQLLLRHCWWSKCWHDWYLLFIFIKFRLSTQADCGSEVFKLKWRFYLENRY